MLHSSTPSYKLNIDLVKNLCEIKVFIHSIFLLLLLVTFLAEETVEITYLISHSVFYFLAMVAIATVNIYNFTYYYYACGSQ